MRESVQAKELTQLYRTFTITWRTAGEAEPRGWLYMPTTVRKSAALLSQTEKCLFSVHNFYSEFGGVDMSWAESREVSVVRWSGVDNVQRLKSQGRS